MMKKVLWALVVVNLALCGANIYHVIFGTDPVLSAVAVAFNLGAATFCAYVATTLDS